MELNAKKLNMPSIRNPQAHATTLLRDFLRGHYPGISQKILFSGIEECVSMAQEERRLSENAEMMKKQERATMTESQRAEDTMVN